MKNIISKGVYIRKMMRGLQIWSQNLNRITLDPFFGKKKLPKVVKIPDLSYFLHFWPNRGQMLSYLNFEARFRILSSFCIAKTPM